MELSFYFDLIVTDKKAACAAIGGFLKDEAHLSILQCEIECCTGNNCNAHFPTLPPTGNKKDYCFLLTK